MNYGLIVCDASPLITLAMADELDVLLRQPWPITVPDAVYNEAANEAHADGIRIANWIENNKDRVRVAATEAGVEQGALLRAGLRARNAGENAAMQVINRFLESEPDKRAVLLYEDDDVRSLPVLDRADIFTTGQLLSALEEARVIQSADRILDEAARAGRNVAAQRASASAAPPARLLEQVRAAGGGTGLLDPTPLSLNLTENPTPDTGRRLGRPGGGRSR